MHQKSQKFVNNQIGDIKLTRSQFITINAVFFAIIILSLGFPLSFGPVSLAALPLVVVIISAQAFGLKSGLITGAMFGIISFVGSFIAPSLLAQAFYNPLVSLFPRILIGLFVYLSNKCLMTIFPKIKQILAYAISASVGILTNTILVIGMILIFNFGKTFLHNEDTLTIGWQWMVALLLQNTIFEFLICIILAPPITIALRAEAKRINQKRAKTNENANNVETIESTND
ncbi:MAG: hypothetical protein LBF12_00810 [Christensenellaceae bacterium]|jgi:uncharacterized membrane protein|nr:hypothetical protein [Christensenellaceae bacterium]